MEFIIFSNDYINSKNYITAGVSKICIDIERKGKAERQAKRDTLISKHKIDPKKIYECTTVPFTVPEKKRTYLVDFTLPNGILVEAKGRWTTEDRAKHLLIKKQHPELDIRILFMSAKTKIRKGSKTTYGDFCDKHGIIWAEKDLPKSWLKT